MDLFKSISTSATATTKGQRAVTAVFCCSRFGRGEVLETTRCSRGRTSDSSFCNSNSNRNRKESAVAGMQQHSQPGWTTTTSGQGWRQDAPSETQRFTIRHARIQRVPYPPAKCLTMVRCPSKMQTVEPALLPSNQNPRSSTAKHSNETPDQTANRVVWSLLEFQLTK